MKEFAAVQVRFNVVMVDVACDGIIRATDISVKVIAGSCILY